jgi:tetratricopeptide (TPR) repeat protein
LASSTSSRSSSPLAALALAAAAALSGCAGVETLPPTASKSVELDGVPFFPQSEYQCGPAALATLLANAGLAVTPDELVDQVYVAGLHGSLQAELLGATRRHRLIPYVLAPTPDALLAELNAGRPVLVLQNLRVANAPAWHYAVVVGFDAERGDVILRSGTERRRREPTARFLRTWARGEHWAFVALTPGELPASATPDLYVRALAGAEALLPRSAADRAFARALETWPDDELVVFAAAGHELAAGDLDGAAALYRRLLSREPRHAAALNNYANVLAARGCYVEARAEARAALALVAPGDELYASIENTAATLERGAARDNGNARCN